MTDDTRRVLWCFIKGDSTVSAPFPIAAPGNATIGQVKGLVWEQGKNSVFRRTDAMEIDLSKVSSKRLADSYQLIPYY